MPVVLRSAPSFDRSTFIPVVRLARKVAPISWSRGDGSVAVPRPIKEDAGEDDSAASWDQALAESLVGCEVIVGLNHVDEASTWKEQIFGVVETVDQENGIAIRIAGQQLNGELYWLPPDLRDFHTRARPGNYRLHTTGEVIVDPDYTTTWIIDHMTKLH